MSKMQADNQVLSCLELKKPLKQYIRSNRILIHVPDSSPGKYVIYLPCYLRVKIQNILSLSLAELYAALNSKIMFDLNITNLPPKMIEYLKENVILRFHRNSVINLKKGEGETTVKVRQFDDEQLIAYRVRTQVTASIIPHIFWTPFQLLYLILSISIPHLQIKDKQLIEELQNYMKDRRVNNYPKPKKIEVRFNLQDYVFPKKIVLKNGIQYGQMVRIIYTDDSSFGTYDLAEKLLQTEYTDEKKAKRFRDRAEMNNKHISMTSCFKSLCPKDPEVEVLEESERSDSLLKNLLKFKMGKIIAYQNAHFQIPLYKIPYVSLVTIFAPLWVLGFISLAIFFQSSDLTGRVASLATVMIAHIAFMPTVRAQLPISPRITFIQILIYLQVLINFFVLVESIRILYSPQDFDWKTNVLFLVSLSIQVFQAVAIILILLMYQCCWSQNYSMAPGNQVQLNIKDWRNDKCDDEINEKVKANNFKLFYFSQFENHSFD